MMLAGRPLLVLSTLATLALRAHAAGRLNCTAVLPDGSTEAAQSVCDNNEITGAQGGPPTSGTNTNRPLTAGAECVADPNVLPNSNTYYYCGYTGANCLNEQGENDDNLCDNGICNAGICMTSLGDSCADNSVCPGNSYCYSQQNGPNGAIGECGALGAQCIDSDVLSAYPGDFYGRFLYGASNCVSQYCDLKTKNCAEQPGIGDPCDPDIGDFACSSGECTEGDRPNDYTCQPTPSGVPQDRARRRRALHLCPSNTKACKLQGTRMGFECVDIMTNLEQCGGCDYEAGSVDCTTLPGVESVGCVDGQCEIYGCADGFKLDAVTGECLL